MRCCGQVHDACPIHGRGKTNLRRSPAVQFINGRCAVGLSEILQHGLNGFRRFKGQENISAYGADFCRNLIEDDHLPVVFHNMGDAPFFIFSGAGMNRTWLHSRLPLSKGVSHFGGFGS